MEDTPEPLPEFGLDGLPELIPLSAPWPTFSIPRLEDKPQNPIIRTLERIRLSNSVQDADLFDDMNGLPAINVEEEECDAGNIWLDVKGMASNYKNNVVSWDTLRSTCRDPQLPSPFISEQPPDVVIAARNCAYLLSSCVDEEITTISVVELFNSLGSMLSGCASVVHEWDATEERFVHAQGSDTKRRLRVDGLDEVVCESYISRFIEFGTHYRRLEMLTMDLRKTTRSTNATVFAFAHALSAVLAWAKREVSHLLSGRRSSVCDVWISFHEVQCVLLEIASLCSRDTTLDPRSYEPLPRRPERLLSRIYDFLSLTTERQASRLVRAVLSYILTVTSRPYFSDLEISTGLVGLEDTLADARRKAFKAHGDDVLIVDREGNADPDSEAELENDMKEEFPSFVSDEFRDAIIRARRSIRILSSPEFEGTQITGLPEFSKLEWIWTDDVVSRRALYQKSEEPPPARTHESRRGRTPGSPVHKYKPELAQFAYFDLEPASLSSSSSYQSIVDFIASYPAHPPVLAPTLPLLAEHVLAPVSVQASSLGRAALQRFLKPCTALHLRAHLVLLRAYLLLQAPAFKARLTSALFSDTEVDEDMEGGAENPMTISRRRARNVNYRDVRRPQEDSGNRRERNNQPWAVGLAFGLTERAQWPPGGSDLSFYLRRVIMDSLEHVRDSENIFTDDEHKDELGDSEFWDEAESRLGFAIRDLPIGTGREKWLDPTLIEALDFLYMEYRPPAPLRCLITADIVSKYQRVFAFLLRLLRVETAMRLVFRLTRPCSFRRIFTDYPDAQTLVLHFRFAAQAFVSVLSAYVADTAVLGNIDAFIARVHYAEVVASSSSEGNNGSGSKGPFTDVYALMQRHSRTLDAVLSACLLRGAQKAVGDILRALLEVILEFAVLVGNAYRSSAIGTRHGDFDEGKASRRVEALYAKFCKTRDGLIKALRKIKERGSKPFALEGSNRPHEGLPAPSGGTEALSDLLLRLAELKDGKK